MGIPDAHCRRGAASAALALTGSLTLAVTIGLISVGGVTLAALII
ncbi:hypothetical protein [Rhodococcus marinonascens]|nr:hypothetical protein [Rhodococcus marinonascens]